MHQGNGDQSFTHLESSDASYVEDDIIGHVQKVTPVMEEEMAKLVEKHASVKQGRVVGLGAGFDLGDKDGNFMFNMHEASAGQALLKRRMKEEGMLTIMRGHHVHCTPPLIITPEQIREGFEILSTCLDSVDEWVEAQ